MKKLYLFDFDGTLTYQDTMFLFLKFYDQKKYYLNFIKHIPLFVLFKIKLLDAERVKKNFISSILKGESKAKIEKKSKDFFNEYYPKIIRTNALEFLENRNYNQSESYMVTASLDIWVQPFAEQLKMNLIATKAEFINDQFTGKFIGKNCNGNEKVVRIKSELKDKKFDKIIAFGDTSGDQPMLTFAHEGHFRFFH